jgi:hypothetical protein
MQATIDENTKRGERRPEAYWAAVADLVSLIQRTRNLELSRPAADGAEESVVATAAVGNCNLRLREALHFLLEARNAEKQRRGASPERPAGRASATV